MLGSLLLSWLILSFVIWMTAKLVPGVHVKGLGGVVLVAALFGVLNVLIGWLLFVIIGIGTLGLGFLLAFITRWIVNALLLKIVDSLTDKLTIVTFGRALVASLVMSGLGAIIDIVLHLT